MDGKSTISKPIDLGAISPKSMILDKKMCFLYALLKYYACPKAFTMAPTTQKINNLFFLLVVLFLSLLPLPTIADDALNLAQKVYNVPNGKDLTTLGRMVLTEKGQSPRIREMVSYRMNKTDGETSNLIRFLDPEDIAGTGLLSIDKIDGDADQWLYLPALDRVRRISSSRKGGRFVGSDLYFEDLQKRKPLKDKHRIIGEQTEGNILCTILESIPIENDESAYTKRLSWIDPDTHIVQRVDYYEKNSLTPSKRWTMRSKKKIQGYWTIIDSRIEDLNTGHQTRMVMDNVLYDQNLPSKLFTSQALADENIETEYRP